MFQYLGLLLKGIFSKSFWTDRWMTFLALLSPGEFYSQVGKKDWDTNAYLLGLTIGLINVIVVSFTLGGLISLFSGIAGLLGICVSLLVGIVLWIIGTLVLYHLVAWIFAFAAKLITKRNDIEKIRPILFSLAPVGLAGIIPIAGGLISIVLAIVLLVIAYEKALKVERGQAVGGSLLGILFAGGALGLFWLAFAALFLGSLLSGMGGLQMAGASNSFVDQAQKIESKVQMPDSWGPFEFIHSRSDAQKLKDASAMLKNILEYNVQEQYDHDLEGGFTAEGYKKLIAKLYPGPDDTANVPTDAYRSAIQQMYSEKADLKAKYAKNDTFNTFDSSFDTLMLSAYDLGKGPATITVPEMEQAKAKQAEAQKQLATYTANLQKMFSAMGAAKPRKATNSTSPSQPAADNANTTVQSTPTAQPDIVSQAAGSIAKQAGGDVAANAAKKLFGL